MSTRRHHRVAAIDRFQIGDFKDNTSRSVKRRLPQMEKYVYFFGDGHADGNGDMKDILGGKGAGLAEMTNAGLPVPPGFTIATSACRLYFENGNKMPEAIAREYPPALEKLERLAGNRLGDPGRPLL